MTGKTDLRILRAERLRTIIEMPEYQDTVGLWLKQALETALHALATATEPHEVHRAQGAYQTMRDFMRRFDSVFSAESQAVEKIQKRTAKALEE